MSMAQIKVIKENGFITFYCTGEWNVLNLTWVIQYLNEQVVQLSNTMITFDLAEVSQFDTAAALVLHKNIRTLEANGNEVTLKTKDSAMESMLEMVRKHAHSNASFLMKLPGILEGIGVATVGLKYEVKGVMAFVGKIFLTLTGVIFSPGHLRWKETLFQMNESAVKALWIIGLTMFLVGIVMAYQSAVQLKIYGANIFIVDMLGISIMRELAPMLTAIVVAGRSGSAYAAQIGVMKMTEEIDAMRTMGFDPFAFLVVPRLLALMIMMPILIFFADILGILGGMVVAHIELDLSAALFLERFAQAVHVQHFWAGIIKGPFFAILIASIGIYRGLQVKNDTESIGYNTTKSVVEAIFAVIICDALFSIIFTNLGF